MAGFNNRGGDYSQPKTWVKPKQQKPNARAKEALRGLQLRGLRVFVLGQRSRRYRWGGRQNHGPVVVP